MIGALRVRSVLPLALVGVNGSKSALSADSKLQPDYGTKVLEERLSAILWTNFVSL